jgi:ATP/maltotriose-dependent transcriptional regulator MalT
LVDQLYRALDHKRTLVSSLAGSGMTTLLAEWQKVETS